MTVALLGAALVSACHENSITIVSPRPGDQVTISSAIPMRVDADLDDLGYSLLLDIRGARDVTWDPPGFPRDCRPCQVDVTIDARSVAPGEHEIYIEAEYDLGAYAIDTVVVTFVAP